MPTNLKDRSINGLFGAKVKRIFKNSKYKNILFIIGNGIICKISNELFYKFR
jgi:hypothetical protein